MKKGERKGKKKRNKGKKHHNVEVYFICSLRNDAVGDSDYMASKDWTAVNNELKMIWTEAGEA
jgi:hypothetical protein